MSPPIRVFVVDDSAFARKVVREALNAAPGLEVVGQARDGLDAVEQITTLLPDVVTLDLVMPELDGLGVLRALRAAGSTARVLIVSMSAADGDLVAEALELGAIDVVQKPTALATDRLLEMRDELIAKVRTVAAARTTRAAQPAPAPIELAAEHASARFGTRLIVLGTSTGGPQALAQIFRALPANLAAPVAAVVHIPPGYTEALAARIDSASALSVCEASDGLALVPGMAVIAQAGMHLKFSVENDRILCRLTTDPFPSTHRPSVDVLFASAAEQLGARVLAGVLTGMGDDGVAGARAIKDRGGRVITEAEASCVVYGMPRAVVEAELSDASAPLDEFAAAIVRRI